MTGIGFGWASVLDRPTLINIPARLASSAGTYTLHLPANSRRERPFMTMFDNILAPPKAV